VITRRKAIGMATATAVTAGLSSLLIGVGPASATPFTCGLGGTLLPGGVCQLTYTTGSPTFTPPAGTTKLEALLVGGGGTGYYGYGGGGGQVTLVNFTDTATAIDFTVGAAGVSSTSVQDTTVTIAQPGTDAGPGAGGDSGNGNVGWNSSQWVDDDLSGAGAGAGASPTDTQDGGAGVVVSAIAPGGSLFTGDTACLGGGGAVYDFNGNYGIATCGGGSVAKVGGSPSLVSPTPNSGGGAGSANNDSETTNPGAAGVVIVRWATVPASTLTFVMDSHGVQVPEQVVITGTSGVEPPAPSAPGEAFNGWFTDPGLTTPANFSDPINTDTTLYASWSALAVTGVNISPFAIPGAIGAIVVGFAVMLVTRRRRRSH